MEGQNSQSPQQISQGLHTCSEQNGHVSAVPDTQPVLQYGNPYATQETRGYYNIFSLGLAEFGGFLCVYLCNIRELLVWSILIETL